MSLSRRFRSHPLQSLLTVLALTLGVAVVTAVAAFLEVGRRSGRSPRRSGRGR